MLRSGIGGAIGRSGSLRRAGRLGGRGNFLFEGLKPAMRKNFGHAANPCGILQIRQTKPYGSAAIDIMQNARHINIKLYGLVPVRQDLLTQSEFARKPMG